MHADDVLEDLPNGEEESRCCEVDCIESISIARIILGKLLLTHWLSLAKDADDQIGFENEKDDKKDQGDQLVERVQRIRLCIIQRVIPVAGPFEGRIEGDVASADEKNN